MKVLAVGLWLLAWFCVSTALAAAWAACRGDDGQLAERAAFLALMALIAAAALAWTGALLW